eukprot:866530_1
MGETWLTNARKQQVTIMPWLNKSIKQQGHRLYKQFIYLSKIYPGDGKKIIQKVRDEFYAHSHETDEQEIKQAFNKGKWHLKELEGTTRIAKYRFLKKNYESNITNSPNPIDKDNNQP